MLFTQEKYDAVLKKIASIRNSKGITQSEMGERMGLSQSAYLKIEKGHSKLDMQRFLSVLIIFKMSGKDFFGDIDDIDSLTSFSNKF
jgi:transcriptional regulator with XRE-family HTH domain